ncbi:NAD(P)H dehydrogenase (quinone) FQR1-like isoform X2 [Carex rostrata]
MATKIYIVYYSMYGHIEKLAKEIQRGASSVKGVEAKLWQVPEILPQEVLEEMNAPPKSNVPVISLKHLLHADGFVFGFPTRFGMMCAQFKAFLDSTGGLWQRQKLVGKPAGLFSSSATQCGGQETTLLSAVTQLAHHGMIFVPTVKGGSPYGAGTFATPADRVPSEAELEQAFYQGKNIAIIAKKLKQS